MAENSSVKPGATTSEWWQSAAGSVVTVLTAVSSSNEVVQVNALWCFAVIVSAYSVSRAISKLGGQKSE